MVSVQSTVDTGHEDMIHDAQMDFYGTRLATCSRYPLPLNPFCH